VHIGLIGGIGPAATEFYYRGLARAHSARGHNMDLTIVNAEVGDLLANMMAGNANAQADIFIALVERLKLAGAEQAAITSLAGHFCIDQLTPRSPLPLVNILPLLNRYFAEQGLTRIGVLGTRTVMESGFYGQVDTTEIVLPSGADLEAAHSNYVAMAMAGFATEDQQQTFFAIGQRLCDDQKVDAVVLGGTDLFLAFDGQDCGFPVIDCAQVHIDALADLSMGDGE